jgi:hypothetical protein
MSDQVSDEIPYDKVLVGGIYEHFKGPYYRVTDLVHYSEDWTKFLVVYYDVEEPVNHRVARPVEMFIEEVERVNPRYKGPRFFHRSGYDDPTDWRLTALKLLRAYMCVAPFDRLALKGDGALSDLELDALIRAMVLRRYYSAQPQMDGAG